MPVVKKKNGEREPYDRNKIRKGLLISCQKRPVSAETIDQMIDKIEKELQSYEKKEVETSFIGDIVMNVLKEVDKVAFIRFASVYKEFVDPEDFIAKVKEVREENK